MLEKLEWRAPGIRLPIQSQAIEEQLVPNEAELLWLHEIEALQFVQSITGEEPESLASALGAGRRNDGQTVAGR